MRQIFCLIKGSGSGLAKFYNQSKTTNTKMEEREVRESCLPKYIMPEQNLKKRTKERKNENKLKKKKNEMKIKNKK